MATQAMKGVLYHLRSLMIEIAKHLDDAEDRPPGAEYGWEASDMAFSIKAAMKEIEEEAEWRKKVDADLWFLLSGDP